MNITIEYKKQKALELMKTLDIYKPYILQHFPEYKYSAVDRYTGIQVFKYLRLYEQYPQIE